MPSSDIIPVCRPTASANALNRLGECLKSGWLGYGPICKELESRFTARGGHALVTANCTAALHLAAQLCRDERRNRVIIPAMTFISTAMAFIYAGFEVDLVDVDPKSGLIDPDDLKNRITEKCCAVVAVHLYGQMADLTDIKSICDSYGVTLVEDCAHRIDLLDPTPPQGDIACYSFNAVKEVTGGEAGLLWCRNPNWMDRAREISNLGLTVDTPSRAAETVHRDYAFGDEVGLKLRGFDVSAALILANLDELEQTRAARARIFSILDAALMTSSAIWPLVRQATDSFLMYIGLAPAELRDGLRQGFASHGIATSIHYPSLSRHPKLCHQSLPGAETFDQQIVTLPCFPAMSDEQLGRIVSAIGILGRERLANS